jgi:hypothetical protein
MHFDHVDDSDDFVALSFTRGLHSFRAARLILGAPAEEYDPGEQR